MLIKIKNKTKSRKIKRMKKRGDIPVTILAIGVVVICTLALLTFIIANLKTNQIALGVSSMELLNSDIEKFHTYLNLGYSAEEATNFIDSATYDSANQEVKFEIKYPKDKPKFIVTYTLKKQGE